MVEFFNKVFRSSDAFDDCGKVRVGFIYIDPNVWTGGYNYYCNLFAALNKYTKGIVQPILFVPSNIESDVEKNLNSIVDLEIIKTDCLTSNKGVFSLVKSIVWGRDTHLVRLIKEHKISVFFENARFIGWRLDVPVIAWIPDLQHKFLPKYFSWTQLIRREVGFRFQVWGGRHIILSSFDAKDAFEKFYKIGVGRISVVRFAVPISENKNKDVDIVKKYNLRESYVYMPNQFWLHKNHALVIEALKLFNAHSENKIQIVCTGNTTNDRHPEYFPTLEKLIVDYKLQDDFRVLGMIPRGDVEALISGSRMVLNPSLFEGWSTTVEEFRSSQSLMLLSDLPVHREQMGEGAIYFNPHSAQDLSDKLNLILNENLRHEMADVHDNLQRMQRFANDFVSAVKMSLK